MLWQPGWGTPRAALMHAHFQGALLRSWSTLSTDIVLTQALFASRFWKRPRMQASWHVDFTTKGEVFERPEAGRLWTIGAERLEKPACPPRLESSSTAEPPLGTGPSPWRALAGVPGPHLSAPEAPLPAPEMRRDTLTVASPHAAEPLIMSPTG